MVEKKRLSDHDRELVERTTRDNLSLRREKDELMPVYRDLSRYLKPMRSNWGFSDETSETYGRYIFDGESIDAKNRLSDGLFGNLVAQSIDWLNFRPRKQKDRDNPKVQAYCSELKTAILDAMARSNFYDAISEGIDDGVVFGTTVTTVQNNEKLKRPVYETLHLQEFLISEGASGEVDVLHREFELSGRQVLEIFSEDKIDSKDLKAMKEDLEKKIRVLHVVYPRYYPGDTDDAVKLDIEKPYASIYFYCGSSMEGIETQHPQYVLHEGGFDSKHFVAWRMRKYAGMTYGGSAGMDALPDVKMLNMQAKTMADAEQLAAKPPIEAPMSMKGKLKIAPGGVSYYTGEAGVKRLFDSVGYPQGIESMKRRGDIIKSHFKNDYFMNMNQMTGSRDRTATEIMEIKAQNAAGMGSIVGRVNSEYIGPLVDQTIAIEADAGRLPPLPEGVDPSILVDIEFTGPLAQAQRKHLTKQGIEAGLQSAFTLAQANPDFLMNINMNGAGRDLMIVNGFPAAWLYAPEQVAKSQQAAQQQRQAEMQRQQQLEAAKAVPAASKAPEPGSPMEKMMGGK